MKLPSFKFNPNKFLNLDKPGFALIKPTIHNFTNFSLNPGLIIYPVINLSQKISSISLSNTILGLHQRLSFDDVYKNKFYGLTNKMALLVSSITLKLKRTSEENILKIIKRIDSRSSKSTSQTTIGILRKYGILGKLSDDDLAKLLVAISKKDKSNQLGLIIGIMSLFTAIFALVLPKNREQMVLILIH